MKTGDLVRYINENHLNGHLVKYPSVYCHLMPQVEGKKVFLYRPLASHIQKLKNSLVCFSSIKMYVLEPISGLLISETDWSS